MSEEKKPIQEIVQREDWQDVRERLVGNWIAKPYWCLKQLTDWIGDVSETSDNKLRIMLNYLTGSGFRSGNIDNSVISSLRDKVKKEMAERGITK